MPDPFDRQPKGSPLILTGLGESAKAHAALMDYCRMGAARGLRDLLARYVQLGNNGPSTPPTTSWNTISNWSHNNSWVARAAAWDAEQERLLREAHAQAVDEMGRRSAQQGRAFQEMAKNLAERLAQYFQLIRPVTVETVDEKGQTVRVLKTNLTPADAGTLARAAAHLYKVGLDAERLALGEATERVDATGLLRKMARSLGLTPSEEEETVADAERILREAKL